MFEDYIPTMVCVAHNRFVPCRRDSPQSPCQMTSEGSKVELVRKFQSEGEDNE